MQINKLIDIFKNITSGEMLRHHRQNVINNYCYLNIYETKY